MFWYPDKGAVRGGRIILNNDAWQDGNIGVDSIAFGYNAEASGGQSAAFGSYATASGASSIALGQGAAATSNYSYAMGRGVSAQGLNSVALGYEAAAKGDQSMVLGLGNSTGTAPQVTGNNSLGIFMGDQGSVNVTASETMAIMGGTMGIGTVSPSSGTGGQLKLDVEGPIGATHYCDENGDNCIAAASLGGGGGGSSLWTASSGTDSIYFNSGTPLVGIGTMIRNTILTSWEARNLVV